MSAYDKLVIARSPLAVLANILLVFHILLLSNLAKGSCKVTGKIWEIRKVFAILHSPPCDK